MVLSLESCRLGSEVGMPWSGQRKTIVQLVYGRIWDRGKVHGNW